MTENYCRICGQALDVQEVNLGPNDRAMLWVSRLTGKWQCSGRDGQEHSRRGGARRSERVTKAISTVRTMVEDGDLTPEQGLRVIYIEAGLAERPSGWDDALKAIKTEAGVPE